MILKQFLLFAGITFLCQMLYPCQIMANSSPLAILRKLQATQDSLAHGDKSAQATQMRLLSEWGAQLAQADEHYLDERPNFYAVLLYLIHGGNPEHVQHLLDKAFTDKNIKESDHQLLEGVFAYAQGREIDFHVALGAEYLDDTGWSSSLRASLYLALTPYMARKNPEIADSRLDYIRLIAPGSLFEEAALRYQIKVVAKLENRDKLLRLVRHYTMRFSDSPYLRDFWTEVVEAVSIMQDVLGQEDIDALLALMPEKLRMIAYLQFARLALIEGRLEQAANNAHSAEKLGLAQGSDTTLAQFYQLAAQAPTIKAHQVQMQLQEITPESLPERDRALIEAARNVARSIAVLPTHISEEMTKAAATLQDDRLQADDFLQQIQTQIDKIDALLEKNR